MFTLCYTVRKIYIFTYVVQDTFLSNTPFEFCGSLSSFLRYAISKFYTYLYHLLLHSKYVYIFLFTFTEVIFLNNSKRFSLLLFIK